MDGRTNRMLVTTLPFALDPNSGPESLETLRQVLGFLHDLQVLSGPSRGVQRLEKVTNSILGFHFLL